MRGERHITENAYMFGLYLQQRFPICLVCCSLMVGYQTQNYRIGIWLSMESSDFMSEQHDTWQPSTLVGMKLL